MTHDNDFIAEDHFRSGASIPTPAMPNPFRGETLTELSDVIIGAYVAHNSVPVANLPALIRSVHDALAGLGQPAAVEALKPLVPAVPIRKSVHEDHIVCLDDGKRFKSLKRHLAGLGMTPEQYRAKWGLDASYPMVAPAYAAKRSALAKEIGLGRKAREAAE